MAEQSRQTPSGRVTDNTTSDIDDDYFVREFMERYKKRQAKLSAATEDLAPSPAKQPATTSKMQALNRELNLQPQRPHIPTSNEVTYPPLSPLPEESSSPNLDEEEEEEDDEERLPDSVSNDENQQAEDLNYSSDLSLDVNSVPGDVTYRAEPVICHSMPDQPTGTGLPTYRPLASPRKQIPSAPPSLPEQPAVLQERLYEQKPQSSQSLPGELTSVEQTIRDLQTKVTRAESTRHQLKKAVEAAKYGTKEHIEAARLLQVTEVEHLNYTNHLAMLKQGVRKKSDSLGSLTMSSIRLKISSKLRNELAEDGVAHFFFCVVTCGSEVRATSILNTDDIRLQDLKACIQFKEKMTFAELPPEFVVKVEVFELIARPQSSNLLSKLTPSKKTKITLQSYFKRVGSLKLTLADKNTKSKNLTQWSEHEKSKYIERECKFELDLKPEQLPTKNGMMHVRSLDAAGRPDWIRFWVDLSGGQLTFWKTRQDSLDGKKPNQVVNFNDLCSETVQKLTPDDALYRQNSFLLYSLQLVAGGERDNLLQRIFKEDPKHKIVKHQLAAESKEDRDAWCAILNKSLHCYREWHGKGRLFTIDEVSEMFSLP